MRGGRLARVRALGALSALSCAALAGRAGAEPIFTGKVALTGLYYTEDDGVADPMKLADRSATSARLGFLDLRGLIEGKRLWKDRLDLRLDLRLRLTGSLDFERKYTTAMADYDPLSSPGTAARGYLGGAEYELRQAYGLLRLSDRLSLQAGRMFVAEADSTKIDGVRLLRGFAGERVVGSVFAGAYPNPFSRSLLTDYSAPCGNGVANVALDASQPGGVAAGPCAASAALALAAGVSARYALANLWGSAALTGVYMNNDGDGGPVRAQSPPGSAPLLLQAPQPGVDAPRVFLSWMNAWRPLERLTVFSDLVVDLYGSGGPQLTRLVASGALRLLRDDRLSLRLGYSHLTSLAINQFLRNTLYNRLTGTTLGAGAPSVVINNLAVLRTGRDEVRGTMDLRLLRRLGGYIDGRFRYRALVGADRDPAAFQAPVYQDQQRSLAGDITAGLRDSGSLAGLRAGLSYTALFDYRADSHVVQVSVGRDLWGERVGVDLSYNLALTRDAGTGATDTCSGDNPFLVGCFGRRSGATHEVGLTATLNPWRTLFFLVDYRFVALLTDPQGDAMAPKELPSILSHSALLRAEYRW